MFRLRTVLVWASVIQVLTLTSLLVGLGQYGGQKAVTILIDDLLLEVEHRVVLELRSLIREAESANATNKSLVESGVISVKAEDGDMWFKLLSHQHVTFPRIGYFTVADNKGEWYGLRTTGSDRAWIGTQNSGGLYSSSLDSEGTRGKRTLLMEQYDTLTRDWYTVPMKTLKRGWSPIYMWSDPNNRILSMTLSEPLRDQEGAFAGLVAADLTLGDIHRFFQGLSVGASGRAFLIERDGTLIATSAQAMPFEVTRFEKTPRRLACLEYPDPTVVMACEAIAAELGPLDSPSRDNAEIETIGGEFEGQRRRVRIRPFRESGLDWILVVVIAEEDFMEEISSVKMWGFLICALVLLIALLFSVFYSSRISKPLALLTREVRKIQEFELDNDFEVDTSFEEMRSLKDSLTRMQAGLSSFKRFVPAALVRQILAAGQEASLGGESREVTILFSDLRGYSSLSESMSPEEVIGFINEYFKAMQEVIARHNGVVIELFGDAILAVFNAPSDVSDHGTAAVCCALEMRAGLSRLNETGGLELGHRIGAHVGRVIAGNIGGDSYMKYGVIGDVVNVAARLEQLNKSFDTSILISEELCSRLPEEMRAKSKYEGETLVKGRKQPQKVFSL